MTEADHHVGLLLGYINVTAPVGEVLYRRPDDSPGPLQGVVFVKLDVHGAGYPSLGRGGDNLGVVTLSDIRQRLHDTLNIHHHSVHRPGNQRQLLLQEVAGQGHTVAHQDFVGRAADAAQVYPPGPLGLSQLYHLRLLSHGDDDLGEQRFVAVDDQVYLVLLEHAQVYLTQHRGRGAEEDVLELGGNHAAPPAVADGRPHPLLKQAAVVLVNPDVGAVHYLHDFPVDAARGHPLPPPQLLALQRRPAQEANLTLLLAELGQGYLADIDGYLLVTAFANLHTPLQGQLQ